MGMLSIPHVAKLISCLSIADVFWGADQVPRFRVATRKSQQLDVKLCFQLGTDKCNNFIIMKTEAEQENVIRLIGVFFLNDGAAYDHVSWLSTDVLNTFYEKTLV